MVYEQENKFHLRHQTQTFYSICNQMKVTKIEATPLETITVAGEEVRVEGTGVETYEVEID